MEALKSQLLPECKNAPASPECQCNFMHFFRNNLNIPRVHLSDGGADHKCDDVPKITRACYESYDHLMTRNAPAPC